MSWTRGIVHGPQSSFYLAGPKPAGAAAGVSFRPGAAGALLGAPSAEFTDQHVALEALWGRRGADLHERLTSARSPDAVLRLLEQSLSARIHRPLLMHPAVAQALARRDTPGSAPVRIADLQRDSGYSPRHFIALFRTAVGLAPKQFFRVRRFNEAVRRMAAGDSLSETAAASGYSDQAHLTREFREFAGVAPTRYRPDGPDRPLHHRRSDGR
jgi:AraC-like DNA-binding protein